MHEFESIRSDPTVYRLANEYYPSNVRCLNVGSSFSRELCCGTHVESTRKIEDFLLVRIDARGQSNKRLYGVTGSYAKNIRHLFEKDFCKRFHRLETDKNQIPIDELFSECRYLRQTYLDERSLEFPYNKRANYSKKLQEIFPDKKLLRKYLLQQLTINPDQLYIQTKADLPIFEIGFMLLHYDDKEKKRQHQPFVVYVNFHQRLFIIYLKNPRQRNDLIQYLKAQFETALIDDFQSEDEKTRELFTKTKKLVVIKFPDHDRFDRLDFQRICTELFSTQF